MLICPDHMQPGYYAPPPAQAPDRNVVTPTDVLIPLGLSVFCGVGGFVWGLMRMVQGHHRPGWVAIGTNAAVWALGFAVWLLFFVLFAGAMASVPTAKSAAPVGTALGTPAVSVPAPAKSSTIPRGTATKKPAPGF